MLEEHTIHAGKKLPGKSSISMWAKSSKISNFDRCDYFFSGRKFESKKPIFGEGKTKICKKKPLKTSLPLQGPIYFEVEGVLYC